MKLYNSLTKKIEDFEPINPPNVGLYTCGPTVYDFDHIGHGRKYVYDDILRRTLEYNGFKVTHVQNITDVGHLVSDADEGEDKLEKGARKAGKTVWEVAKFYEAEHFKAMDKLNILRPTVSCRATEHIQEQIDLVKKIIDNGYGYETPEAVYFDITKLSDYGKLFGQDVQDKKVGVRDTVKTGEHKKHPADFALWFKTVGRFADHTMHWPSPWEEGFPGWHLECSAMSMKYLGNQFDIHTGGEDHLSIHHPNEIAQSESATGKKPFVKYWIHYAFLKVDGKKMSKSLGNFYTIDDIAKKGFDPLALRYLYLTAHYRDTLNFTWDSLQAAQERLEKLRVNLLELSQSELGKEKKEIDQNSLDKFKKAINEDLNMPQALVVLEEILRADMSNIKKYKTVIKLDDILGLNLGNSKLEKVDGAKTPIFTNIKPMLGGPTISMIDLRYEARQKGDFSTADKLRDDLLKEGKIVSDVSFGTMVYKAGDKLNEKEEEN